jgi:hypothetical protein
VTRRRGILYSGHSKDKERLVYRLFQAVSPIETRKLAYKQAHLAIVLENNSGPIRKDGHAIFFTLL